MGQMIFLALFLAGFTLGIFAALFIFVPEAREEVWDPQHLPISSKNKSHVVTQESVTAPSLYPKPTLSLVSK